MNKPNPFEVNRRILKSHLGHGSARVLLLVADYAGHGESCCWACNATIAKDAGLKSRQVSRIIGALQAGGWIVVERDGTSKFSKRTIRLGPACYSNAAPSSPLPGVHPAADYQCTQQPITSAPSSPLPAHLVDDYHQTSPRTSPRTSPASDLSRGREREARPPASMNSIETNPDWIRFAGPIQAAYAEARKAASDAWWTLPVDAHMALDFASRLGGDRLVREFQRNGDAIQVRDGGWWCLAEACMVTTSLASVGRPAAYLLAIADRIARCEQEISPSVDKAMDRELARIQAERLRLQETWKDLHLKRALGARAPEALRTLQAFEDVERAGDRVPDHQRLDYGLLDFMPFVAWRIGGAWQGFRSVVSSALAGNPSMAWGDVVLDVIPDWLDGPRPHPLATQEPRCA